MYSVFSAGVLKSLNDSKTFNHKDNSSAQSCIYISKSHDYTKIVFEYEDDVYTTTKNIYIPYINRTGLIFYFFTDKIVIVKNNRSNVTEQPKDVFYNILYVVNYLTQIIESSKDTFDIFNNVIDELIKYITPSEAIFEQYLFNTNQPLLCFISTSDRHPGHAIIDNTLQYDRILHYKCNSIFVSRNENIVPLNGIEKIFTTIHYGSINGEDIKDELYNKHSYIFLRLPVTSNYGSLFNFKNKIYNIQGITNNDQVVLVAKYDSATKGKNILNQERIFKHIISFFIEHSDIKKFAIVAYVNGVNTQGVFKDAEKHSCLISRLKRRYTNCSIISYTDKTYNDLIPLLYKSFCYFSPGGTMQHIIHYVTESPGFILNCERSTYTREFKDYVYFFPKNFQKKDNVYPDTKTSGFKPNVKIKAVRFLQHLQLFYNKFLNGNV